MTTLVVVGKSPQAILDEFCEPTDTPAPVLPAESLDPGEVFVYRPGEAVYRVRCDPPKEKLKRHARKYAEGDLGEDKRFYFVDPTAH